MHFEKDCLSFIELCFVQSFLAGRRSVDCPAARFLTKSVSGTNCGLSQWGSRPWPLGPGTESRPGPGPGARQERDPVITSPGLASPLRNMIYDSSLVPGRPMWAAHNLDPASPGEEGDCDSTPATAGTMNFVRFVKRKFHILHRGLTESQQLTGGWLWQLQRLS